VQIFSLKKKTKQQNQQGKAMQTTFHYSLSYKYWVHKTKKNFIGGQKITA